MYCKAKVKKENHTWLGIMISCKWEAVEYQVHISQSWTTLVWCLVKGHFHMLRWQSGTLSLTKSGHPTRSHPSDHHLLLIFFSSPADCVCWGGGERERECGLVVYLKVWELFFSIILFHVMGLLLQRRNGTEKNTLLWISSRTSE